MAPPTVLLDRPAQQTKGSDFAPLLREIKNLLLGMSYGWWNDKHNRHHANPNHSDKDPDVATGLIAIHLSPIAGSAATGS